MAINKDTSRIVSVVLPIEHYEAIKILADKDTRSISNKIALICKDYLEMEGNFNDKMECLKNR